jgi:hypothetical protein
MKWYYALGFVLALQMFMYLAQTTVADLGSDYQISPTAQAVYTEYDGGNYTLKGDVVNFIPSSSGSVDESSGEVFTDSYRTGGSWLQTGKNANFITAPTTLMKELGFGDAVAFAFGVFWYIFIGSLVLYQFLRGGA